MAVQKKQKYKYRNKIKINLEVIRQRKLIKQNTIVSYKDYKYKFSIGNKISRARFNYTEKSYISSKGSIYRLYTSIV